MTVKERLHERIEAMSDEEAAQTLRLLDAREDATARLMDSAPRDDEPETEAERRAAAEALSDAAPRATHADVLREFGVT